MSYRLTPPQPSPSTGREPISPPLYTGEVGRGWLGHYKMSYMVADVGSSKLVTVIRQLSDEYTEDSDACQTSRNFKERCISIQAS